MTTYRTAPDLDALAGRWPAALEDAVRLPTQTRAWITAAAETFHPEAADLAVTATEDGRALAPLVRREGRLALLGVAQLSEPTDLLAADDAARLALAREVVHLGTPLRLERVPTGSPTIAALREASGRVVCRPTEGSPWIPLDESWRDPEAKLSSRRRSDQRRARRRAEEEGPVRAEIHAPTPETLDAHLETAWAVEAKSWRAGRDGAMAQDPLRGPFFRRWAERTAADGTLRIALFYAGETPIAMQLATVVANGYWLLKIGFDEAWKRASPGMLLIAETIRYAAEQDLATYELMGVVEPWTHMWTEHVRESVSVRTYPLSASGLSALAADGWANVRARLQKDRA